MSIADFDLQIERLGPFLKPLAMKLTKDSEGAADLMQETFFKACKNRHRFQDGTNLKAWLYTIMKNTFITEYHKKQRRNTFVDTTDNNHFINNSTDGVIDNLSTGNFIMEDVNGALEQLKEEYREPFMMYFNGWKYHEIADMLAIPIGTVKNRIHIARKELKSSLGVYQTKE